MLQTEKLKLRKSAIWITFFVFPIISALMGTFNFAQNREQLTNEWYSLWTQFTIFYCYFIFPTMIGIYCSYLFRLEHFNHNWNMIMANPTPISHIFLAKLITASAMILLTQFFSGILFFISGKLVGLNGVPPLALISWLFFGFLAGTLIAALQLCFSLVIRSFAIPVAISFMGGIAGLAIRLKGYGEFCPYSLLSIGMCTNNPEQPISCGITVFLLSFILFVFLFLSFGIIWLNKHDVIAG
jgi:ABC-2 type transport system permease protein